MSKEQTTIFKGIAILMMLFFHLYGGADIEQWCTPLVYIGGKPLVGMLSRACYPVTFFLLFTGYGLTYSFDCGRLTFATQIRRLLRLYILYWVVSIVFVSIGMVIDPANYPKSWLHVAANVTAVHCTYNGEAWFLFPYTLICLSSPWLLRGVTALRQWWHKMVFIVFYAFCFLALKWLVSLYPTSIFVAHVHNYVALLFYFYLGVLLYRLIAAQGKASVSLPRPFSMPLVAGSLLIILVTVKSCFKVTLADGIYAFAVIVLLLQFTWRGRVAQVLYHLGKHSAAMWLTHTYFAVYLFSDFIHAPRYPLLIFLLLVAVTWLSAFPLERISQFICSIILPKCKKQLLL